MIVGIEYNDVEHPHCDIVRIPDDAYAKFIFNWSVRWKSQCRMAHYNSRIIPLPNYKGPAFLQLK